MSVINTSSLIDVFNSLVVEAGKRVKSDRDPTPCIDASKTMLDQIKIVREFQRQEMMEARWEEDMKQATSAGEFQKEIPSIPN